MAELFKWAKSHNQTGVTVRKRDRVNHYHLPSITASQLNIQTSWAEYNYDKGTLSFEIYLRTPFEWLNQRAMRNTAGRKCAEILGVDKWLYYVEQPKGSRRVKDQYVYFQQFACVCDIPSDEKMRACWNVLKDAAIEGVESPEYRYKRFDQSQAPEKRTYRLLKYREGKEYESERD